MKRLVMFSYILLLLVLIVLSGFNFSPDVIEKIEGQKQGIIIQKPEGTTNEEYITSIKTVVDQCNADIMYKYVKIDGNKSDNNYYTVENNNDFIDASIKKLLESNHFEEWSQIAAYDLTSGKYYVNMDKVDEVVNGIRERGYEVQIDTTTSVVGKISVVLFGGIPALLMLMSMIFYTLSIGKKNMLKKMEGYSLTDLLLCEIKVQMPYYIIALIVLEMAAFVAARIYFDKAVLPYICYQLKYVIGGFCVLIFGGMVSAIIAGFQNKAEYIKGKVPKKGMYFITMAGSVIFMVFLVFFMTIGIRNVKIYYDTYKTAQHLSEKIEGYVTFPQYENNASATGLEDNYMELYKQTVSQYQGILVDANNYSYNLVLGKTPCEEYDQDSITVNENYLKFNPIYDETGQLISISEDDNQINILLPNTKIDKKEKYVSYVKVGYNCNAKVLTYDADKTKVFSYNATAGNGAGGELDEPVIIVVNEANLIGAEVSAYCSTGAYFIKANTGNPYEELKPILEKTGVSMVTPETPYISSKFSEVLSHQAGMFTLYTSQTLILSLGLICLIVFSGTLFCENYKDMIVNKLIEGHTIYECIWKHLVIKLIIYILSGIFTIVLGKLMMVSMNYYIIAGSLVFDIIFTITICKRIAKRKVYDLVKGAE